MIRWHRHFGFGDYPWPEQTMSPYVAPIRDDSEIMLCRCRWQGTRREMEVKMPESISEKREYRCPLCGQEELKDGWRIEHKNIYIIGVSGKIRDYYIDPNWFNDKKGMKKHDIPNLPGLTESESDDYREMEKNGMECYSEHGIWVFNRLKDRIVGAKNATL